MENLFLAHGGAKPPTATPFTTNLPRTSRNQGIRLRLSTAPFPLATQQRNFARFVRQSVSICGAVECVRSKRSHDWRYQAITLKTPPKSVTPHKCRVRGGKLRFPTVRCEGSSCPRIHSLKRDGQ